MDLWWLWIVAGIIFAIVEIFTPGFVFLAIGVSCVITGLLSLIPGLSFIFQFIIFGVSIISLVIFSRPLVKKIYGKEDSKSITNVDALIGKIGIVKIEIDNDKSQGYVKIGGEDWSARSLSGDNIKVGEKVLVQRLEGNKVIVTNKFIL